MKASLLAVILMCFLQGVHSCSKRGTPVINPKPTPPPWFGMSSFGRNINNKCVCGNSSGYRTNKKFGSNDTYHKTALNEYPWHAYIKVTIAKEHDFRKIAESDGSYDCSGTLINDRIILTSAECVYQFDPAQNSNTLNENMNKVQPQQAKVWMNIRERSNIDSMSMPLTVEKIIVHPYFPFQKDSSGFDARQTDHDIALLKIKPIKFEMEKTISPICIHHSQIGNRINRALDSPEKTVISVGWVPGRDHLKSFLLNVTNCPEEDNPKKPLDLRNYYCRVCIHEPECQNPSMNYGSSIVYHHNHQDGGSYRIFQYGILSWVLPLVIRHGKFRVRPTKFRLFTNIYRPQILSFIDYHSYNAEAQWCNESPDMSVRIVGTLKERAKPKAGRNYPHRSESSESEEASTTSTEPPEPEESESESEEFNSIPGHTK